MNRILKFSAAGVVLVVLLAAAAAGWFIYSVQPVRSGMATVSGLTAAVSIRYDERGVPHIRAENERDMYRALGYVHAQDRLFQMEMIRRLSRGELAEVLGPKLLPVDRLFRTLGIRANADAAAEKMDKSSPAYIALMAYLGGINEFQATHPVPIEFKLLGIPKRPFEPHDTMAVAGYLAYSFAAAFRTEPVLTYVRDTLGADYLRIFDVGPHPKGALAATAASTPVTTLSQGDWAGLNQLARLSQEALEPLGVAQFEGSNAWVIAGSHTASGKPLLAGDPHIAYSLPSVWYEAHLSAPGFELYGHYQALNPVALLGHNRQFGWSLTMFQNDDVDLVAEKTNPDNANQVWYHGKWVDLQQRTEIIKVKGADPVILTLRRSPHGPIITDAFEENFGTTPVAVWWTLLETDNPIVEAFYELNRADTLAKARNAASKIHAPGLNVVWASAAGDIAWWASAKLPRRPPTTQPSFILDGSASEADKNGFLPWQDNPHEENPARGYILSANHEPAAVGGASVPGYYNLADRARELNERLSQPGVKWDVLNSQALQLDNRTGYGPRVLKPLLSELQAIVTDPGEHALLGQLAVWDGHHALDSVAATLFNQFLYQLAKDTMEEKLGDVQFKNLLRTRALDSALPRLTADAASPWWDNRQTTALETRADTLKLVWRHTIDHLKNTLGADPASWTWSKAHTLTHNHPLAQQKPLDKVFNIGPFSVPGGREVPNNLASAIGPAPWAVTTGPSTRRLIDFSDVGKSLGINPVGQSGVLLDEHYADQAATFAAGGYVPQHFSDDDVITHTRSRLILSPSAGVAAH